MRRTISKIPYRPSSAPFSTSSGGGGRGRAGPNPFSFTVPSNDPAAQGQGHGRGRGVPVNPSPLRNEFDSFLNNDSTSAASGRGRGIGFSPPNLSPPPPPSSGNESDSNFQPPKPSVSSAAPGRGRGAGFSLPNFSPLPPPSGKESESNYQPSKPSIKTPFLFGAAQSDGAESGAAPSQGKPLQTGILGVLAGSGRGMPPRPHTPPSLPQSDRTRLAGGRGRTLAANRDAPPVREQLGPTRPRDTPVREQLAQGERGRRPEQKLNLIRGDRGGGARDERGWDRRAGAATKQDNRRKEIQYERDDFRKGQYFKDPAYEEKLAKKIGPENMKKVYEGLDEMASRVFTDPKEEALVEAYETNLRLECEPEFIMEEFGTNPDIDEKAQISIRDALEKMKPFLMAYEGIKSNEEWEEIMEETMKKVPLVKGIIDLYGSPDRVTAKEQCEKLEQSAKTIPASAPASVKRFTDRAVLSLQSNPGWGFEKKCQFMDKLIMEVQQNYK